MQRHQRYHIFRLLSRRLRYNTLIGLFLALAPWVSGQETVRGIVKDCHSSNPLAFVNLISADGRWGTSTDIEGRFSLEGVSLPVQLSFTYIGYGPVRIWVNKAEDIAEVMMCPEVLNLSEVVILPWNNPALAMIRKVLEQENFY